MPRSLQILCWLAFAAVLGSALTAQEFVVRAAFAADSHVDPPAIEWLRHQVLAARPEWPAGRSPDAPFTVHWQRGRWQFASALTLPAGLVVAGELEVDRNLIPFAITTDGRETWDVGDGELPPTLTAIVEALQLRADGPPRTLDVSVLIANIAGPAAEGDDSAMQLATGGGQCGELTLAITSRAKGFAVRGRSGGGLSVPAALAWCALQRDAATRPATDDDGWRLRAYGARAEAARQLQRSGPDGLPALRGMLYADEASRLAAIDGMVRLHAAAELPRIVAAADPSMPLAVAAARTALRELWPVASAPTRTATLTVLRRVHSLGSATEPVDDSEPDPRYSRLAVLMVVLVGLLGLWMRERARTA